MAQAKKKASTKTAKKSQPRKVGSKANTRTAAKKQKEQKPNMFFIISMSVLAATLLFADLLMIVA